MEISIGNELKDSYKQTSKWIHNGITWLTDIEEFYRDRAVLEKEYSDKLNELCKRQFDKKSKVLASLSVGDEPQITPGSLESASLVLWTDVLSQTEAIAKEHGHLSKEFNTKICDNLKSLGSKTTSVSKRIERVNEFLTAEKSKIEDEVNKSKKHYDSLCVSTESAREKSEKNQKYAQKLHDKEVEMNMGKNDYLIKIAQANRLKDKYFYQDLPEVLDYYQELNETRVTILNKLLKNALIIERNSGDKIKEKLHLIDGTIDQNNPKLDTSMFVKHNARDWQEPQDFYFIPSSIWHDDESLITKEPELGQLKRILYTSSTEYPKLENACVESKQKLEEITLDRKAQDSITLKFDTKLSQTLQALETFMKNDTTRVKSEVLIEIIQNFAGDQDLSYVEQKVEHKSKFGLFRKKTIKSDDENELTSVKSIKSIDTKHTGLFNLRKSLTQSTHSTPSPTGAARALYDYTATGGDEVDLIAGDTFNIAEPDTGNGWTLIQLQSGTTGLVPTTYVETISVAVNTTGGSKKGPSVAPKRGAKRVQHLEALYDYAADGDDEISISAGDVIVLIQDDLDGSGWTEGELNGVRGMFPTSYVRKT